MVSFPHFLKVSFKLIKCSLSYSLQCDPRPFSEFTQVWTISSLTASKMHFGGHHWLSGNSMLIERWNCPQMNVQSINGSLQNFLYFKFYNFSTFSNNFGHLCIGSIQKSFFEKIAYNSEPFLSSSQFACEASKNRDYPHLLTGFFVNALW